MREIDEYPDDESHIEDRRTEVKDYEAHSLTTEERDEIIRRYNDEYSTRHVTSDTDDGLKQPDTRVTDSEELHPLHSDAQEAKEWDVDVWNPEILGIPVASEEHVMTILQDSMPGLFKHQKFETFRKQISTHMKAMHEFGDRSRVTYREIHDFATRIDYPSTTVEAWVLQGVQPNSYRIINENAITQEKAEVLVSEMRERLQELTTQARLDECLDTPYHEKRTKTLPSFKKDYENACGFYRFLDELVDGGVLSDIAQRAGIRRLDARRYIEEGATPRVIRKVLHQSLDEIEAIKERQLIKDEVQYEQLLCRQSHVCDLEGFDDMDRHMRGYLKLKEMQRTDSLPDIPQEELAEMLNISGSRLNLYLSGKSAPKMQSTLLLHEDLRNIYEGKLPPLAFESRIEPELVFRELHQYKDLETPEIDTLASSIRTIYEQTDISSKVRWLDLHRYAPTGQEWFKGIASICESNCAEIEHALNQQLGFDKDSPQRLRLGVLSSRIYLRLENIQEIDWMQLYNDEMFHFHDQETVDVLLSMAKDRLDIKGDISLSRLVHQVADYDKTVTNDGMNSDLHSQASYLKGSTLSLLLDSCDVTIQELQDEISAIGRFDRRLIRNPEFSDDLLEIDMAFARLFGAGLSDGHIDQFRVFCYCEADIDRVEIFNEHVKFFGDVDYTETVDEKGTHDLRYSSVLGRMLEKRGFTVGDKTVLNRGIPEFIMNGPIEVQVEYLKQLWPEDGHFINGENCHTYFGWTRSACLLDPEKDLKYGIPRHSVKKILSFVQDYGTFTEESSFTNRESYPRYVLTGADLLRFTKSSDTTVSNPANWLNSYIESNKPLLLKHEKELLNNIGAATRDNCSEIVYYVDTGRVSVLFHAATKSLDDGMVVALVAPPDDKRKRMRVVEWVQSDPERHQRISSELLAKGFQISLDWKR
jgi:transcriptional regulator with XRE-family HTH domain